MRNPVVERAPAKINLDLRILAREPDGYHSLVTTFQALELHDVLEAAPADEFSLEIDGVVDVGPADDNLVLRAARAYRDAVRRAPHVRFRLDKRIPAGAGLGGGSSDAAAALRAMNALAGDALPQEALRELGASIGSDVPFFLCGAARAHARGRGELLVPLPSPDSAEVVLVDPGFSISTRAAFGWWDEADAARPVSFADAAEPGAEASTLAELGRLGRNDFEPVVFARHPELPLIRRWLLEGGATHALLSGSGSCVYGIFAERASAAAAARALREAAPLTHVLQTRTAR